MQTKKNSNLSMPWSKWKRSYESSSARGDKAQRQRLQERLTSVDIEQRTCM
ncbi:hypothetical protein ISN45_At03g056490 [Arabidopsis thaliana x Arabidopsis arenosa]|uniref:Uncharacterized protein n=2 Tax=Arabidopsis TaxID=3701 RepID=A0A8T2FJ27_ARASU|nr:hypothetical protein ISN45_At03g056490 [Arabidopsis thaliana x Arabidopsis arenosa]KAG7635436.1 hypothetical protein ISN44_As03g055300 [Arabidopsis suecica]